MPDVRSAPGGDAKNLSNVVVKSEPVHCEGTEPAGAGPVAGASSSYDLAVASSEPVNDEQGGDSTECSSSFGDSFCEADDEEDHGDPEVNSPFSAHVDSDQASLTPRKKKVTAEWRKAVRPMLWRCQWLELRMKDLLSQVSNYDKQLALIKQGKELQQAVTKTNGSRTESGQHCKGHENSSMERRKRKRHENTVDTSLYIKKHQILSYFYDKQNKGAETDGLLIDDDSNGPVGDDIKGGLDTAGLFEKSKEYDMVSEQFTLQKILLTIDGIQSQVHRLQERLSKARSKQEKMASFVDHAQVKVAEKRQRTKKRSFSYKNEYDRYTKPQKKKNLNILLKEDRPARAVISTLSERATDCLIEDAKRNSEEKSGEGSQSHKKAINVDHLLDIDSSLPNGHMGDLCRENADDILIDNQAAKEGYQPFENVKHPLEKSPELTEKVEKTVPSKVENTSAPVKVENTSPAVKQEPVLEKPPALKAVYSGKKRGRKPKKKDGGSASPSKSQSRGASKTSTAKKKTESTPLAAKKQKTETTPPAAGQSESARSKKQKATKTPFPAKKGKTGISAGKKQNAESSSSAASKETSENTPKLRIEKAVLVAVNSRRSQRVRKPKIY